MKLLNEEQDEKLQELHRNGKQRVNLIFKLKFSMRVTFIEVKDYYSIRLHNESKDISYQRGNIVIIDRVDPETAACGCYLADQEFTKASYAGLG